MKISQTKDPTLLPGWRLGRSAVCEVANDQLGRGDAPCIDGEDGLDQIADVTDRQILAAVHAGVSQTLPAE
jgi:hypothetical protein